MGMLIAAIALFAAVWAATAAVRADGSTTPALAGDRPNGLPRPGARDLHTVAHGTLGRARVPRWT